MSVSLQEVLENAGYHVESDLNDAQWLLAQTDEFEELKDRAFALIETAEEEELE